MKRSLLVLSLLCSSLTAFAGRTLSVSVSLEETHKECPRTKRNAQTIFDITNTKKASWNIDETLQCNWEIIRDDEKGIALDAQLIRHDNGKSVILAKPLLIMTHDKEGKIVLGEKTPNHATKLEMTFKVSDLQ